MIYWRLVEWHCSTISYCSLNNHGKSSMYLHRIVTDIASQRSTLGESKCRSKKILLYYLGHSALPGGHRSSLELGVRVAVRYNHTLVLLTRYIILTSFILY